MPQYYNQRNRNNQYGGQNSGQGGYNQNSYQQQTSMGSSSGYNQNSYQQQSNMGRQQMMNPWQSGMMPNVGGGGMAGGRSDEAALAFNILNQVLATDTPIRNSGQNQNRGFQNQRSRQSGMDNRLDDRRSRDRSNRKQNDRSRQWSQRSRSPHNRDNRSNSNRRNDRNAGSVKDRLGKPADRNRQSGSKKNQNKEQTSDKRRKSSDQRSSDGKSSMGSSQAKGNKDSSKNQNNKQTKIEHSPEVIKCLKCDLCDVTSFDSIESFREHKKSDDHKKLFDTHIKRTSSVLALLKADSKLASYREMEKAGSANKNSDHHCVKCDCLVTEKFKFHKKTIEHELVEDYMSRECCGTQYNVRKEFEEHCLNIPHLKKEADTEDPEEEIPNIPIDTAEAEKAEEVIREMKHTERKLRQEKDLTPLEYPDYDPETPWGVRFIQKRRNFYCKPCKKSFAMNNVMALAHCRSFSHYQMTIAQFQPNLEDIEDDYEDIGFKKQEEYERKKKEEQEKLDQAEDAEMMDESSVKDKVNQSKEEGDTIDDEEGNKEIDDDMGEIMPPLEDGGILLEDVDKENDEEEEEAKYEEQEENKEEVGYEEDQENKEEVKSEAEEIQEEMVEEPEENKTEVEEINNEEQEDKTEDEEVCEAEASKADEGVQEVEEKMDTSEAVQEEEEATAEPTTIKEEKEEQVVEPVKPKRGRGRGRGRRSAPVQF